MPDGIPFVDEAISEVVNIVDITQDFARQLYFNPTIIGENDISVTDGVLSSDATFSVNIEAGETVFVVVAAADTAKDNTSIDDLFVDINAAIADAGLAGQIIAERQTPFDSSIVTSLSDVTDMPAEDLPSARRAIGSRLSDRFEVVNSIRKSTCLTWASKIGSVIDYLDIAGEMQQATIDHLTLSTFAFRFDSSGPASA